MLAYGRDGRYVRTESIERIAHVSSAGHVRGNQSGSGAELEMGMKMGTWKSGMDGAYVRGESHQLNGEEKIESEIFRTEIGTAHTTTAAAREETNRHSDPKDGILKTVHIQLHSG